MPTDYADMIEATIRRRLDQPTADSTLDGAAVATAAAVLGLPFEFPSPSAVVDLLGHRRAIYEPLVDYGRRIAGDLKSQISSPPTDLPASRGAAIAAAAWGAIGSTEFFQSVCRLRNPAGGFLTAAPADNLESYWYHELQLLHAVDAHADRTSDVEIQSVVEEVARYHHDVTQPDHSTGEPWGLSAFLKSPDTYPTADGLLHAAVTADPTGPRGVTLLLLADVLYRLRREH